MKSYIVIFSIVSSMIIFWGCKRSFIEADPQGTLVEGQVLSTVGIEDLVLGAYSLMNGNINGTWGNYGPSSSQWIFGEVMSDNAHKGSNNTDQPSIAELELHQATSSNIQLPPMWTNYFEGINRCNKALKLLGDLQNSDITPKFSQERVMEITGELNMLRAHYYFFLWRVFKNLPLIDENSSVADALKIGNQEGDVTAFIESCLKTAVNNLGYDKPLGERGRMDKFGAEALLGKLYLYQKRYDEALPLFKDIIDKKPILESLDYRANFTIDGEGGPEGILVDVNYLSPDGSGTRANIGDMLQGGLYGTAPITCCGFFRASIDLVNSFKTDNNGLPFLNKDDYRSDVYISDLGLTGNEKADYEVNTAISFDPRIDYTIGRRGVEFLDWGIFPGDNWIRDPTYGGPFVARKNLINLSEVGSQSVSGTNQINALDVSIIRLADVYLMAAECAVLSNTVDLQYALNLINSVRNRAALLPGMHTVTGSLAADYNVAPYPSFPDKTYAFNALMTERRLELAMEGHRFFDLIRWDVAKETLEDYQNFEKEYLTASQAISFSDRDKLLPIPQQEIDRSGGLIKQNPGY